MPARSRAKSPPATCSTDLVCLTAGRRELAVLLVGGPRGAWRLPSARWRAGTLGDAAAALTRGVLGRDAAWRDQVGAFTTGAHPDGAGMSVAFAVAVPRGIPVSADLMWHSVAKLPAQLAVRHRAEITAATAFVNTRMDFEPIAFRMLPAAFTLSALQEVYEVLLGEGLHKASFRRALGAARLVEPTDEWQSDGRGRPAQLYRYAPRHRRGVKRIVRFELLGQ